MLVDSWQMKLGRLYCQQSSQTHQTIRKMNVTFGGLPQHLNTCGQRNTTNLNTSSNNISDEDSDNKFQKPEQQHKEFYWNIILGGVCQKDLEEAYNQIVYWRKNIFMVPTGATGKKFIDEISKSMDKRHVTQEYSIEIN